MISLQRLLLVIKAVVKLYGCIVSSGVQNAAEWKEFVWAWSMSCSPDDMVERSARSCGKLGLEFKIFDLKPFVMSSLVNHSAFIIWPFFTCILTLVSRVRVVLRLINYGNADKAHLDFRERRREENKKGRQRTVVRESAWFLLLRWAMCVCVASSSNPRKQEYRKREGKRKRGKGGWVIMC